MRSRWIEDALAVVGIVQAALYGTMEALARGGFLTHTEHPGFPWVTVIIFAGCVLPKTLGRATAGRVWDAFAGKVGARARESDAEGDRAGGASPPSGDGWI